MKNTMNTMSTMNTRRIVSFEENFCELSTSNDSFLLTSDDICTVDYESSMEYLIHIVSTALCDNTSDVADDEMTTMRFLWILLYC